MFASKISDNTTISDAISDNETNSTTLICPTLTSGGSIPDPDIKGETSDKINVVEAVAESTIKTETDEGSYKSKSKNFILSLLKNNDAVDSHQGHPNNDEESKESTLSSSESKIRGPALKREKSHTDSIDRKKKRVKFSILSDEIIPNNDDVAEPSCCDNKVSPEIHTESTFSTKLKKLLSRANKKTEKEQKEECSDATQVPCTNTDIDSRISDKASKFSTGVEAAVNDIVGSERVFKCENDGLNDAFETNISDIDFIDSNVESLDSSFNEEQNITNEESTTQFSDSIEQDIANEEPDPDVDGIGLAPKREGTFTLDGPPPSKLKKSGEDKVMKSNSSDTIKSDESTKEDVNRNGPTDVNNGSFKFPKKSVAFYIQSENDPDVKNTCCDNLDKKESILKRPRPTSFEQSLVNEKEEEKVKIDTPSPSPPSTISSSSETIQTCLPRTSVSNIGSSAKRTITTAWKNAITRQDSIELKKNDNSSATKLIKISSQSKELKPKDNLVTKKKNTQDETPRQDKSINNKKIIWNWSSDNASKATKSKATPKPAVAKPKTNDNLEEKDSTNKEEMSQSQEIVSRRPKAKSSSVTRNSSWSGMSLSMPHLKRDSTFMKIDAKKYDSEKERLHNEVIKLNVEKDRLTGEVTDLKGKLDEEVATRKSQKRSYESKLRQQRDEEGKKHELQLCDLRNRLEEEKREALTQQKESLTRTYETEMLRNNRGRDEETRRLLGEARVTVERLQTSLRREAMKETQPVQCQHQSTDRELEKLTRELTVIKDHKKKLEETIQRHQTAERARVSEIRRIHEQHEGSLAKVMKASKQEATRLLEEIKSKDRTISSLEKKLNQQDAKLRQQEEKQRDASKDDTGRKLSSRNSVSSFTSNKGCRSPQQKEEILENISVKDGASTTDKEPPCVTPTISTSTQSDEVDPYILEEGPPEAVADMKAAEQITKLKKIVEEQQHQISSLIQQAIERENPDHLQVQVWPQKRESCMKASDLPTVMEQVEAPPRDCYDRLQVPGAVQPFRRCVSLLAPNSNYRGQSTSSSSPAIDWAREQKIKSLESSNQSLQAELQEARDHAELLEFRILEVTEGVDKFSESKEPTVDQGTNTTEEYPPSTHISLPIPQDDLSLPLSIDSGLDLSSDTKARITEGKSWLSQLSKLAVHSTDKTAACSLASLLDWLSQHPSVPLSPIQHGTPTPMSPTAKSLSRMGAEDHVMFTGGDLTLLAARLQETLTDPSAQETALVDTIAKLRTLDSSLSNLQSRVSSLTEENKELQDALTALSEAHETRTEASGTESEIVHRKTPSIHSDLSDAESDSDPHHHHNHHSSTRHTKILSTTTSFQESGIFDASCDFVNAATQTNKPIELTPIMLSDIGCLSDDASSGCGSGTEDVDLKSAVARLASIRSAVQERDLRSIRIQDLQESDEYLKSTLEEQRVSMSKLEYDSIVAAERQLQHSLEVLKADRDDLALQCQELQVQINQTNRRGSSDGEEMLRGECNVLSQKLEVSERCRRELFEEKCELEEAENDARLMVQRLESQLDAAREMESLLSASLSQEQQLSRELQRKFRDYQLLEKDRRAREECLEQEGRESTEKLAALSEARDALASQISFAAYGLLLVQMWKKMDDRHTAKALVPCSAYSALTVTPFNNVCDNQVLNKLELGYSKDEHAGVPVQRKCSTCVVNNQNVELVDREIQTVEVSMIDIKKSQKQDEQSLRRTLNEDEEESTPAKKKLKATMTRSTSTMAHLDELLSEREKFYLEQIESLQKEKMSLRKGQEMERSDSLQHYTDLEDELEELKHKLQDAEKDKCSLIFRMEELEDSRDLARKDMQKQFEEIKADMNRNNDLFDMEKAALQRGYESRLQEVLEERNRLESRCRELEQKLSTLRKELEVASGAIASDVVDLDSDGRVKDVAKSGKVSPHVYKVANDGELLDKIRDLVKSESSLRQRIGELEKKESAYRETIEEADTIMSSHVTSYTHRIEELEGAIEQHVAKIKQLETSEERLRGALRTNCRTSEGERISQLLDRVIEIENSELKLKERVWSLERIEKELQIKLVESEKTNQSLRSELRDQEELVQKLMSLQSENNLLSVELQQAHDSLRKLSDVQQSESYFRSRVEELEATENTLRDALHQADILIVQRERKLKEQIRLLDEELHSCKTQHENSSVKALEARETEISLRRHLEELKSRLQESEKELRESSSENINHETQHRSEVTKLRNQLKLVNNQLTELDGLNCALRDRVSAAEGEKETVTSQLEERIRRHEQDVLSLNLQITTRDSKVEELEGQLQQLRHSTAAGELDALSCTPLSGIHTAITQLTTSIQGCEVCSRSQSENLADLTNQLSTLSDLIEGHTSEASDITHTDMNVTFDMDENTNSAENLVTEDSLSTAPPSLAKEGVMDSLSEEHSYTSNDSNTQGPLNRRDANRRSRRRIDEKSRRRLQMPSTTGSVLDELEEKVRELEEVIATKDEELKIADNEAEELNSKLQAKDEELLQKAVETDRLNTTLSSLREQLMCTIEDYERSRLSLETKHKVDVEEVARRMERLTEEVERLISRGRLKDSIIATLVAQIRALLRSGNMSVVINQLQKLSKAPSGPSTSQACPPALQDDEDCLENYNIDFDIEKVCTLLNQPYKEMQ